ncbi:hypothetical protein NMY22_g5646 [Coprinellus aureogranulatus]|nr:hypothetical protein NMY22_g5646 [Coprinellus aureogranulatus]
MAPRSTSPYGRSGQSAMANYASPPPVSPTSPEEPTVKKKRKRADAHQLKVLNETYSRTAFPSTEERHALAKALDMSARSVQIWSVITVKLTSFTPDFSLQVPKQTAIYAPDQSPVKQLCLIVPPAIWPDFPSVGKDDRREHRPRTGPPVELPQWAAVPRRCSIHGFASRHPPLSYLSFIEPPLSKP